MLKTVWGISEGHSLKVSKWPSLRSPGNNMSNEGPEKRREEKRGRGRGGEGGEKNPHTPERTRDLKQAYHCTCLLLSAPSPQLLHNHILFLLIQQTRLMTLELLFFLFLLPESSSGPDTCDQRPTIPSYIPSPVIVSFETESHYEVLNAHREVQTGFPLVGSYSVPELCGFFPF